MHFCMELQKSMDLLYKQPTQPVDVNIRSDSAGAGSLPISSTLPGGGGPSPPSPFQGPSSPGGSLSMENLKYTALQNVFAPKSE